MNLMLVLLCVGAAATQPSTAASTRLAAIALDRSSPKATVRSFLAALDADDLDAALSCWHTADVNQERLLRASLGMVFDIERVKRRVAERLGQQAADSLQMGMPPKEESEVEPLEKAGEKRLKDGSVELDWYLLGHPAILIKAPDGFRLSADSYLNDTEPGEPPREYDAKFEEGMKIVAEMSRQLQQVADGVRDGKYKSVDEVQVRIGEIMGKVLGATTTTAPSK